MGENDPLRFTNSCLPILYKDCVAGRYLINPCACDNYYQCQSNYEVILRSCPGGTLYNHNTGPPCVEKNVVIFNEICKPLEPWKQCNNSASSSELSQIAKKCGGTFSPQNTPAPKDATPGSGGVSPGVIVGVAVALCAVIAILAVLVVYYRRKKREELRETTTKESIRSIGADNKAYFSEANRESIYAKISEDKMQDPVYNNSVDERPDLPTRPPSQQSSSGIDVNMSMGTDAEYVEPTSTMKTSVNDKLSLGKDANDKEYIEISPDKSDPPSTPYDNSWQAD